jgi:hypothetical protein
MLVTIIRIETRMTGHVGNHIVRFLKNLKPILKSIRC